MLVYTCVVCVKFLVLLLHGSGICWQWVAVQEKQAGSLVGNLSQRIQGERNPILLMLCVERGDIHNPPLKKSTVAAL